MVEGEVKKKRIEGKEVRQEEKEMSTRGRRTRHTVLALGPFWSAN